MKAYLIKEIDILSGDLRAEGYEVQTTIKLNRNTFFMTAKPLSEQDIKDLKRARPETRITEGG